LKLNAIFDYPEVKKEDITLVYEINMLRIRLKNPESRFGTMTDIDGTIYKGNNKYNMEILLA
jgi:HSP20 family molecular chaperone IbpA